MRDKSREEKKSGGKTLSPGFLNIAHTRIVEKAHEQPLVEPQTWQR